MAKDSAGRWGRVHLAAIERIPSTAAFSVYAYLCVHADVAGQAWPRPDVIASDLGITEATVRRAFTTLIDLDEVRRTNVAGRYCVVRLAPRGRPVGG